MTTNSDSGMHREAGHEELSLIKILRVVIVTPLLWLILVIVGAVLISSGALPDSLSPFLRLTGQALPLLAILSLSVGVVLTRRKGRWHKSLSFHFIAGGLAQMAPLALLMHHYPAVLAAPLLPFLLTLGYSATERRN